MSDPDFPPDYYAILGVPATATQAEVKAAFRRQAAQHHPDRGGTHARMVLINAAGETLTDPAKRAAYDAEQAARRAGAAAAAASANASPPPESARQPPVIDSWKSLVRDFIDAKYERAPWLGWPPKISDSRGGQLFVIMGGLAGVSLGQLLRQMYAAAPDRGGRMAVSMFNLVLILILGPSAGAAFHWLLRRILLMFYPGENDQRS